MKVCGDFGPLLLPDALIAFGRQVSDQSSDPWAKCDGDSQTGETNGQKHRAEFEETTDANVEKAETADKEDHADENSHSARFFDIGIEEAGKWSGT